MTVRVLLVLVAGIGATDTLSAAPPPKTPPKKVLYYPVVVGAKWEYEGSGRTVVSKVEKEDSGTLVTVEYGWDAGKGTNCHKYLVSETGVWMTEESGQTYTPAWQLFKAPHKPGDKWDVAVKRQGFEISGNYSLGDEETVTVPAGKFSAIKVVCTDYRVGQGGPGSTHTSWFAPGVGEVKREAADGTPIRMLKSFTPGKE